MVALSVAPTKVVASRNQTMRHMFRMEAHIITGTNQCARTSWMLVPELFCSPQKRRERTTPLTDEPSRSEARSKSRPCPCQERRDKDGAAQWDKRKSWASPHQGVVFHPFAL